MSLKCVWQIRRKDHTVPFPGHGDLPKNTIKGPDHENGKKRSFDLSPMERSRQQLAKMHEIRDLFKPI